MRIWLVGHVPVSLFLLVWRAIWCSIFFPYTVELKITSFLGSPKVFDFEHIVAEWNPCEFGLLIYTVQITLSGLSWICPLLNNVTSLGDDSLSTKQHSRSAGVIFIFLGWWTVCVMRVCVAPYLSLLSVWLYSFSFCSILFLLIAFILPL